MSQDCDLVIVGSGPAGTSLALHLVQLDPSWANRLVVVDSATHPRPKLCGGGVTHYAECVLTRLGLELPAEHVPVTKARFRHRHQSFSVTADPLFRVFDRAQLDHWLVQQARARDIQFQEGSPVSDIQKVDDGWIVTTSQSVIRTNAIVGADGAISAVRRLLQWEDPTRLARLLEVITPEISNDSHQDAAGEAYFDFHEMSEGLQGYYWDFPMQLDGKACVNRGVFDSRFLPHPNRPSHRAILDAALQRRGLDRKDYQLKSHPIRWFDPATPLSREGVLLVGDAAGTDPFLGEGIAFALGYGRPAAETIHHGFKEGDLSFSDYKRNLMSERIFRHLRLRRRLARFAYSPRAAWVTDSLWGLTRFVSRLTPWSDPSFQPLLGKRAQRYLQ